MLKREGEFKPGDKLPTETEFCQKLGVGRNSIREAIKMLAAIGVVEVFRGDGTYVATKVSPEIFNPLIFSLILEINYEIKKFYGEKVVYITHKKPTKKVCYFVGYKTFVYNGSGTGKRNYSINQIDYSKLV